MKRLWVISASISAVMVGWTGRSAMRAQAESAEARLELKAVSRQACEIVRLRAASETMALPERSSTPLATKVSAAMERCGFQPGTLQSLSPESVTDGGSGCIRQRATLTLAGLSLAQLGAFLGEWRDGDYAVSSIDLTPLERPTSAASPGADGPLRAVLTLEGLFRKGPPSSTGAQR